MHFAHQNDDDDDGDDDDDDVLRCSDVLLLFIARCA